MRHLACAGLAAVALLATLSPAATNAPRTGLVQYSNGEILEGSVSLTPGRKLTLHQDPELRILDLARVSEIRFRPEKELMERKWRFVEAGRTEKEYEGEPYPVRHIAAEVVLADGSKLDGHLYTTVLYLEGEERNEKVVLRAKQRGKAGQTFVDLVYPVRIVLHGDTAATSGAITLHTEPDVRKIAALTHGALVRLEGEVTGVPGEFRLPSALGAPVFLAFQTAEGPAVGWPQSNDAAAAQRVTAALETARDFFDDRKLLGVYRDEEDDNLYSLVMLSRHGKTTLNDQLSQPWRLGLWRWKQDHTGRLMLAGRGWFFRGKTRPGVTPPPVRLVPRAWRPMLMDGEKVFLNK